MQLLDEATWRARATAHEARVDALVADHLARRQRGEKHPVHDFLFGYYSYRPAQLRRWHPGYGVDLGGSDGFDGPLADEALLAARRPLVEATHRLLAATASRPAHLGCFGMHEWAMVYRLAADETRHPAYPLRLGPDGTDRVVASHRVACSHFDAYRFFTAPARPLNTLSPTATDRPDFEQPGCLHAGMDLYKHAFRLAPLVAAELVVDCFELARDIRVLDLRASPYDFGDGGSGVVGGLAPVRVESPEGKREYAAAQAGFAERGAPLRARLVAACERLLDSPTAVAGGHHADPERHPDRR